MGKAKVSQTREVLELPVGGAEDRPEVIPDPYVILNQVDKEIQSGLEQNDPVAVLGVIKRHFSNRHVSDIAAIRACYRAASGWKDMQQGDNFLDFVATDVGKGAETVKRYAMIGRMMEEVVPEKYRRTMWCRPIRNLVAISQAVNEHGDFSDDEWKQLSMCVNSQEVRLKLDEFLEKERKPTNRLVLRISREGQISAHRKGKRESVGVLRLEPENQLIAEAVQRIIAAAGILED